MEIVQATDSLQAHTAAHADAEPANILCAARDGIESGDGVGSTYGLDFTRDKLSLHSDTKERIKTMCAEMRTGSSGGSKARSGGRSCEKKQKAPTSFKRTVAAQQWI